jgi:type I restriction enzyme S subunit
MKRWPSTPLADAYWFQEGPGVRNWQFRNDGIKLLNVANITKEGLLDLSKTTRYLSVNEVEEKYSHFLLDKGDLVIASSGISFENGLLRTRGAFVEVRHLPLCLNTSTIRFKATRVSSLAWLRYWLDSIEFREQITRLVTGSAQQNFGPSHLKATKISLPPLPEQKRIVKLLDAAHELRNLRSQADRRTDALIPALFHKMFGQHITAPPIVTSTVGLKAPLGWRWAQLTEVARLATGHTPSRRHPEWWGGDIPWISLSDIRELDGTVATVTSEHVTQEGIANSSSVKLPKGAVCFSRTASVGFVTMMGQEMATSQDFVNWVCGPRIDPIFLMGALMQARKHLRSLASGSTHKTIYFPTVKQFAAIIPPLALQKEFAARVIEIWALRRQQSASRNRLDDLSKSLLHRAFNGKL